MSRIASVLIPMPLPEAFDYAEPDGMGLEPEIGRASCRERVS
jgi:primosomal protein N' (replication factor Y)